MNKNNVGEHEEQYTTISEEDLARIEMYNNKPEGSEARKLALEMLYEKYEKWIYSQVHERFPTYVPSHLEDLCSEARVGFIKALKSYEPAKGAITTHTKTEIHSAMYSYITRFVHHTKPHEAPKLRKIRLLAEQYQKEYGEMPTAYQLAVATNTKIRDVEQALTVISNAEMDDQIFERKDEYIDGPETMTIEKEKFDALYTALNSLSEYERVIIMRRFGLEDGPSTYREIAKELGITSDQIPGLYQAAQVKLRQHPALQAIFYDKFDFQKSLLLESDLGFLPVEVADATMEALMDDEEELMVIPDLTEIATFMSV